MNSTRRDSMAGCLLRQARYFERFARFLRKLADRLADGEITCDDASEQLEKWQEENPNE